MGQKWVINRFRANGLRCAQEDRVNETDVPGYLYFNDRFLERKGGCQELFYSQIVCASECSLATSS